jgi:hypothetical protein
MIESRTKFRFMAALAIAGLFAVGLSATYLFFVYRGTGPKLAEVESVEARAARCGKNPSGELVLAGEAMAPLADSTALADAGKIKPIFVNGSTVGLEIGQIRAGSLYDRAGLCDGDVVTMVGGIRLDSPEATLDAYEQLRDQEIIAIELLRRGSSATYRVRIE